MKQVTVVTDSLCSVSPELAAEYDIIVVPFHLIFDGKDYLDDAFDREHLFARLESYQNLPTHSACSQGELLGAFKRASQKAKDILYISMSSKMSTDYKVALTIKERAVQDLPGATLEVVDSASVTGGGLLVVLAAARAANEGKSLSEIAQIARQIAEKVTLVHIPETLFFFERAGRSGGEPKIVDAPVRIYPMLEMDALSGGTGRFISKHRSKIKAIEGLLELAKARCKDKRMYTAISYTNNPEEAQALKDKLQSQLEVSQVHIAPHSVVGCVVAGPRCLTLGFYCGD